jgi:hypothetical protein
VAKHFNRITLLTCLIPECRNDRSFGLVAERPGSDPQPPPTAKSHENDPDLFQRFSQIQSLIACRLALKVYVDLA